MALRAIGVYLKSKDATVSVIQIHVVIHVNLRNMRLAAFLKDHEMQMRWTHVVAALESDELSHRAVDRDGITTCRKHKAVGWL